MGGMLTRKDQSATPPTTSTTSIAGREVLSGDPTPSSASFRLALACLGHCKSTPVAHKGRRKKEAP